MNDLKQEFEELFLFLDRAQITAKGANDRLKDAYAWFSSKLEAERKQVWDKAIEICKSTEAKHPYKQIGNPDSYCQYNEGWEDACDSINGKLESERDKLTTEKTDRPKIICICGSTRFADLHAIARWEFEKDGKAICLMINYLPAGYFEKFGNDHYGEKFGNKEILDELHKRKIDLADEVFVINKDGYIGESTRSEIEYAISHNKPVKYLEAQQ